MAVSITGGQLRQLLKANADEAARAERGRCAIEVQERKHILFMGAQSDDPDTASAYRFAAQEFQRLEDTFAESARKPREPE